MRNLFGIDTSHWKRDIILANTPGDFVYTKATEGNYYVDDACDPIVQQAIALGRKFGVYHFATNLKTDPITEANYFVDNIQGYVGQGILILDYENYFWGDGSHANNPLDVGWAKAWLDQVYARTGVKPLIYMSLSIVQGADWSPVIQGDYGLIAAAYVRGNDPIPNYAIDLNQDPNPGWGAVGNIMWQFTSTGRLDGYGGNLDCNVFYGDGDVWDAYAGKHATPPTEPAPAPDPPAPVPDPAPVPPSPQPSPEPSPAPQPDPVPTPPNPDPMPTPEPTPTPNPEPAPTPKTSFWTAVIAFLAQLWEAIASSFKKKG